MKKPKKTEEFVWPEYRTDRERIKAYSNKFKNKTIGEAFSDVYKLNLPHADSYNDTPHELQVGDMVYARITNIEKNRVDFDTSKFKSTVLSNCNLYKYDKFKHFLPTDEIKLKVTNKIRDRIYVDVLQPMIDDFVLPRVNTPWIQKDIDNIIPVRVENLQLTQGGFIGKAVIPNVTDFIGQKYTVDAFIPGSQIVLNITRDFESFIGKSVDTFIINYMMKPGEDNKMSLVCSAKEYIKTYGEINMIYMFKHWLDDDEEWKEISSKRVTGIVTGTINSSKRFGENVIKKCGIFVEIPEWSMTGMVLTDPDILKNYKAGDEVLVQMDKFEETLKYNPLVQQMQHIEPYVIEDNKIKRCNLKPVLKFAM